jgi:hypothetical protein
MSSSSSSDDELEAMARAGRGGIHRRVGAANKPARQGAGADGTRDGAVAWTRRLHPPLPEWNGRGVAPVPLNGGELSGESGGVECGGYDLVGVGE